MFTLLFVDDNRNIREFCRREFELEGYRVLLAADGEEALDILERAAPDLVVLDVHMPRMDGPEAIRRMLGQGLPVPVVFFTARLECVCADADTPCVEKSEDLTALKATIAGLLNEG